jgi:hypothetical protein
MGSDPMQSSECPANLKYPQKPGGITDPEYSIKVGIEYFASCLRAAQVKAPDDIAGISLALQGYNFGGGYISWAEERGGYSTQTAVEFSQLKAQLLGWDSYGDVDLCFSCFALLLSFGAAGERILFLSAAIRFVYCFQRVWLSEWGTAQGY